jgi:glycosyltransferase involved in cell wall biosynthesis
LARKDLDAPVVLTSHGGDLFLDSVRLRKPGVKEKIIHGLEAADALIAISRFTREGYRRLCPHVQNVHDIPNGVDVDAMSTPAPRPTDLDPAIVPGEYALFLGRLVPRKGVDLLLGALGGLPDTGRVQLVVAGDGASRTTLETLAASHGLAGRVRFLGATSGSCKTYLLQNALCGVVPSRTWEAFGLVVLEMFAAGTPVIASRLPGLEDLIDPGRTGWLVPPENPEMLRRALAEALAAPEHTRQRGEAAQQVAMRFDWTAIAERHLELYQELVARHRGAPRLTYARLRTGAAQSEAGHEPALANETL